MWCILVSQAVLLYARGDRLEGAEVAREDSSWMEDYHNDEREEHWSSVEGVLICFVIPELLGKLAVEIACEFEKTIDNTYLNMLA